MSIGSVLRMSILYVFETSTTVYVFSLLFLWMAEWRCKQVNVQRNIAYMYKTHARERIIFNIFLQQEEKSNIWQLFSIRSHIKYIFC